MSCHQQPWWIMSFSVELGFGQRQREMANTGICQQLLFWFSQLEETAFKICFVVWKVRFTSQLLRFFSPDRSTAAEVNCICEQLICLREMLHCSVPWSWYLWGVLPPSCPSYAVSSEAFFFPWCLSAWEDVTWNSSDKEIGWSII